jgi:hypothetical protein
LIETLNCSGERRSAPPNPLFFPHLGRAHLHNYFVYQYTDIGRAVQTVRSNGLEHFPFLCSETCAAFAAQHVRDPLDGIRAERDDRGKGTLK